MWSRQASLDLRGTTVLGVGHFTVPPDVVEARDRLPSANDNVTKSWSTIRTIVVPHGITGVPRRSPIKARKRTPWNPGPEAESIVERAEAATGSPTGFRRIKAGEPAGRL